MAIDRQTSGQYKLEKFSEALEAARKMQQEWMTYGLDFVDRYVEDIEGDWLDNWGEDEEVAVIKSLSAFLESDDPVAMRVRQYLGTRSISEVAAEFERIYLTCSKDEWRYAGGEVLAGTVIAGGSSRESSNEDAEIELQDLAQSLLEKLAEIWVKFE